MNENQSAVKQQKNSHIRFIAGLLVLVFALTGFIGILIQGTGYISSTSARREKEKNSEFNSFLIPVVAVDPTPFDDIATASKAELVEIAIWTILSSDLNPDEYDYSSGKLAIPVEKVNEAFYKYFGSQTEIKHQTVEGYGYEFSYDPVDSVYYIPLTSIIPVYTPTVIGSEKKGEATVITVGLINSSVWMQDNITGNLTSAQPEKYIKVTLRKTGKESFISAIQSSATPETAQAN